MDFFRRLLSGNTIDVYSDKELNGLLELVVFKSVNVSIDKLYNTFLSGIKEMDYTVIQKVIELSKKHDIQFKYKNSYGVIDYFTIDKILFSQFFSENNDLFKPIYLPNANNYEALKKDNDLLSPEYDLLMKIVKNNAIQFDVDEHGNTMLHIFFHRFANNIKRYIDFSDMFGRDKLYEVNTMGYTPFGLYVKEKSSNIANKALVLLSSYGSVTPKFGYPSEIKHVKEMFDNISGDLRMLSSVVCRVAKKHSGLIILDGQKNPNSVAKIFDDVGLQNKFDKMAVYLEKVYTDAPTIKFMVDEQIFEKVEKILLEIDTNEDYNKKNIMKV